MLVGFLYMKRPETWNPGDLYSLLRVVVCKGGFHEFRNVLF